MLKLAPWLNLTNNDPFKASSTNWRVASTIRNMHTCLLAAQKLYDPKLPAFIVEAKVNTIMCLLFQDGQDILNFLYNTPDEPCPSKQAASPAHSILISDSEVTINYLSVEGNQPEETYYNKSHGQGISDYFKPSSHSYNDTSSDYDYYKSNSTKADYNPYSSNNTRSNNQGSYPYHYYNSNSTKADYTPYSNNNTCSQSQGSYPNYHQYNSSNIERGNSSYSRENSGYFDIKSYSHNNTKTNYTSSNNNTCSRSQSSYPDYHQYNSSILGGGNSSYRQNYPSSLETSQDIEPVPSRKNKTSKYNSDDEESLTKDDYDFWI
ncbi:hypothetical protein DSO57_1009812 [Entomophthora muscae]|uniref:Uncharacterized protein n=1 Tax=Entomophthora muscae TaxID=34485 RepID=A0ACC2RXW3_9FUNG|nr:hypothetical protein DSO57_1009812 [Entomophthora muscae]